MSRVATTIRLPSPAPRPRFEDYDVDALAIEFDAAGQGLGWRLELGRSFDIFWVLPTETRDRLRLVHVDSAVVYVDEPSLIQDPCCLTVPDLHWSGENLGVVRGHEGDRVLVSADVHVVNGIFTVEARVRCPDGKIRGYRCRTLSDDDRT